MVLKHIADLWKFTLNEYQTGLWSSIYVEQVQVQRPDLRPVLHDIHPGGCQVAGLNGAYDSLASFPEAAISSEKKNKIDYPK